MLEPIAVPRPASCLASHEQLAMVPGTISQPPSGPDTPEALNLGYACGALRVTLDKDSESIGPRAHVSGFLGGLAAAGITTRRYLAGDEAPKRAAAVGSGRQMSSSVLRRSAVDCARLALRYELRRRARHAIGDVDVLYERQATFQDIGRAFQRAGSWWIIESNGPFWYEAGIQRQSLAFVQIARRLELNAYRDADLVITVSEALKEIIVRESGRSPNAIYVLPNATDCQRFDPAKAVATRLASSLVVGWVGYVTEWAGLDDMLRAVAAVRDTGRDFHLVVVGDGPHRTSLEALAKREGIQDIVHFVGHVPWDQTPGLMAGFDIAFSGQREMSIGAMYHSPQKLYEYQAMALPILASDYPDARKLVLNSQTGWLFTSGDVRDLARALASALDATDLRQRGALARASVARHHTWDVRVRELLAELARRGMTGSDRTGSRP